MDDTPRIADLRKKVEKDPGSRLFAQLAEELRKEGRFEDAIAVAQTGLQKNPNYPSARLTLARAQLDADRPGEARSELQQIVKASPDNILASRLLGEALQSLGDHDEAIRQFEHTLRLSPEDKSLAGRIDELKATGVRPVAPTLPPFPSAVRGSPPSPGQATRVAQGSRALDRDLASGSFRPGSFSPQDLPRAEVDRASSVADADPRDDLDSVRLPATIAFGQFEQFGDAPVAPEGPATEEAPPAPTVDGSPEVALAPDEVDPGNQTLPVTSLTLADLYMQQGLKAEASAVLSQVLLDEPDNAQARSKLAAATDALTEALPDAGDPFAEIWASPKAIGAGPQIPARVEVAATGTAPTHAEVRDLSILWLKDFLGAVEREAADQRATERGAF